MNGDTTIRPREGQGPLPVVLVIFALILVAWGGWYVGTYSAGFRGGVPDRRTPAAAIGPVATTQTAAADRLGRRTYNLCLGCHQIDGQGVPGTTPPLAGSQWVTGDPDRLARIVLDGLQGPIEVRGVVYDQLMPGWRVLDDERLAAVLSYTRGAWENDAPPVDAALVAQVRERTQDRRQPWTVSSLAPPP